jgi:large subunit ribosomal protein L5
MTMATEIRPPTHAFRVLWKDTAVPVLKERLGRTNVLSLPRVTHVVVAAGVGKHGREGRYLEGAEKGLTLITGQKPVRTLARKSIAGFKLRAGQVAGLKVTLRGARMEDFLTRLLHVVLPRVRDFRGIPVKNIDAQGNLSLGFREAHAFPEVDAQSVETPFGLQVTVVTTARSRDEARVLFEGLRFPLTENVVEQVVTMGPQRKVKKRTRDV